MTGMHESVGYTKRRQPLTESDARIQRFVEHLEERRSKIAGEGDGYLMCWDVEAIHRLLTSCWAFGSTLKAATKDSAGRVPESDVEQNGIFRIVALLLGLDCSLRMLERAIRESHSEIAVAWSGRQSATDETEKTIRSWIQAWYDLLLEVSKISNRVSGLIVGTEAVGNLRVGCGEGEADGCVGFSDEFWSLLGEAGEVGDPIYSPREPLRGDS